MTKEEVEHIIKRYPFIRQAIESGLPEITYYIGKRKYYDRITEEVKGVCSIILAVLDAEQDQSVRFMITGILKGKTDTNIMKDLPLSRTTYYFCKIKFIDKVEKACASKGIITFEEILKERIA